MPLNRSDHRNIQQREDVFLCGRNDKTSHVCISQSSGGPGVKHRRHASSQACRKRIDRIQPDTAEDMNMQIDQPRCDNEVISLDHVFTVRYKVWTGLLNLSVQSTGKSRDAKFWQIANAGVGLGLAICARLVTRRLRVFRR